MNFKSILIGTFFLSIIFSASAQNSASNQNGDIPTQKYRFGFLVGTNSVITNKFNPVGLTLGASAEYNVAKSWYIRALPTLTMNNYDLPATNLHYEATYFELPVLAMFKPGNGSFTPIFSAGPDVKMNLTGAMAPTVALDAAIGFEKKFSAFIFAPEVRYSYQSQFQTIYLTLTFKGVH